MRLHKWLGSIAIVAVFMLLIGNLSASMVRDMPIRVTQPDGTELELLVSGDEYHNWLHDKDNYTIIQHPLSGYYCYAVQNGEGIVASDFVAGTGSPQRYGITPGINIAPSLYKQMRSEKFYMPAERNAPTTGTINNLVIFIRFSDETEFGDALSTYSGWFNTGTSSLKNYFLESSYNQLTVNTTFYPVTGTSYVLSWQDSQPRAYYQPYNATTNPTGYNGDTQRRQREFTLLQNATNGVSSQIPSSINIDSDSDGKVDNVVFIVKGAAGAWSSLLWPHRWSLYDRFVYINGKRVYDFNFQLQTFLTSRGVGVLCHEFFHTLGAPDLYHYTSNGIDPAGSWDIMESDQNPPQHMTAFMKYKYGHWISSIPVISSDQTYTLNPLTSSTGNCYRIDSNDASQYYVVEFRKKTGTFESSIPGSGLLIYRIDTSCEDGNADGPPDELYIFRPNGTTSVNGTLSSAHYSSETARVKIDNTTNPTPFLQNGSAGNLYLCEIGSSSGTTMTFRKGSPYVDFSTNPFTQGFDSNTFPPEGWVNQAVSGSYLFSRSTSGTYPTCSPQSGTGMLYYNSDVAPVGNSAMIASPKIVCTDPTGYGYQLSFWMYRDGNQSTTLDKVDVYMNSTANLSGTPVLLGTIHRARQQSPVVSSTGWKQYFFALPFSATGDYYAILNAVSAGGYNIFVDSISIAKVPLAAVSPGPANLATDIHFAQPLSWLNGGGFPTGYKLYLGTNDPPTNLLNGQNLGTATTYTPSTDWLLGTTYYWSVAPYNAAGLANNPPVWSFTVMSVTPVFPLTEDFGITGVAFPPTSWTKHSGVLSNPTPLGINGTGSWVQDDFCNITSTPQNFAARINIYGANRTGWLISPLMDIPSSAILEFDLALTDYANSNSITTDPNGLTGTDDRFAVLIGNGYTWSSANLLRMWDNAGSSYVYNSIPAYGEKVYIDLSAYTGKKYIAFYGESLVSNADNDLFVDNVHVRQASVNAEITLNAASWNAEEVLLNTSYSRKFTITNTGQAPLQISAISLSGAPAFSLSDVPSLPVALFLGQSKSFYANFSPVTSGEQNATITITDNRAQTQIPLAGIGFDARIAVLPYSQDFDAKPMPELPLGWTPFVNSTSQNAYVKTSTTYPNSFPNSLCLFNSTDTAADLRLVTPEVLIPMHNVRLRFMAKGDTAGYPLLIGTMDSPNGTFTQVAQVSLAATHTRYTVSFATYSGANHYIAFKHGLGGSSRYIYVDDLLLENLLEADMLLSSIQGPRLATTDEELDFTISVTNNGTQTQDSYRINLVFLGDRSVLATALVIDPLAPEVTANHTLRCTYSTPGMLSLIAEVVLPGDGCLSNDASDPVPLTVYPPEAFIPVVGNDESAATSNALPFNFFYKNSVCETIYLADEMQMTAGMISGLAIVNDFVQDLNAQPIKIWMKNTDAANLSSAWLPFEGYTLVYDGLMDFPLGVNTLLIELQTPFLFTGTNLAVRFNRPMDSVYYNTANHFYYNEDTIYSGRTRYLYSDNTQYDPTAPSAAGTICNYIPLSAFVVMQASPVTLQTPNPVLTKDAGGLLLSWRVHTGYYGYRIYSTGDINQWPETPEAVVYEPHYYPQDAICRFFRIVAFSFPHDIRTIRQNLSNRKPTQPAWVIPPDELQGTRNKD